MRKNKLLISTLLPVAAFVSVVGAGYSAWYFQGNSTADTTTGITVTPVVAGGGISISSSEHGLTLDQKTTTNNPDAKGITWKDIKVKYTPDSTASSGSAVGEGTITWSVDVPEGFATYISFVESNSWTITNIYQEQEFTLNLATLGLDYKAEPKNYTEWSAMNTALDGKSITVNFEVNYTYTE